MVSKKLHSAQDRTMKCDATLLGYHYFHPVRTCIDADRSGQKQILDEMKCRCGQSAMDEAYVREQWTKRNQWDLPEPGA